MGDTDVSADAETAIRDIVDAELGRFGVDHVEVVDAEDADGDPALLVRVYYSSPEADPDPKVAASLVLKLNDTLYAMNERRFAHVAHKIPEQSRQARRRG